MPAVVRRLPRRVRIGCGYIIDVALVSQTTLRDVLEADDGRFDGAWENLLGEPEGDKLGIAGRIYIYNALPSRGKRRAYFHELKHAITDIADWNLDKDTP